MTGPVTSTVDYASADGLAMLARAGPGELGLSGDGGGTWFLPRLVGMRRAAELYFGQRVQIVAGQVAERYLPGLTLRP